MTSAKRRAWLAVFLWWVTILALLPNGRAMVDALRSAGLLTVTVSVVLLGMLLGLALMALRLRRRGALGARQAVVLVLLVAALVALSHAWPRPEERWHVVQYATLAALLWAAQSGSPVRRISLAVLWAAAAGWLDEGIQLLLPNRVYDWADVGLNAGAGGLGALCAGLASWARRLDATTELP